MTEKIHLSPASGSLPDMVAASVVNQLLRDHPEIKHNKLYVDVGFTFNGQPVSYQEMVETFSSSLDAVVRQKALALLSADEGLAQMRAALVSATVTIKQIIAKLPNPEGDF
jgi:hypothetical protein